MIHAAESLHWYTRTGATAYTVKSRDGSDRPATLRDARKLNLVPSVTSIIKCASAPALERWKLDQMLHAALTLPRVNGESEQDYIGRIWKDSQETARKAAERGTAIHTAVQGHYEGQAPDHSLWLYVKGAKEAVKGWAPECEKWIPERSFASRIGYGGKVDLSAFDHDTGYILDFKTKEFGPKDELRTWDEHAMQLAAYREGLGYPDANCAIVYVSVTHPGLVKVLQIDEEDLKKGWTMFYSLLHYWQAKTGYVSSFERMAA